MTSSSRSPRPVRTPSGTDTETPARERSRSSTSCCRTGSSSRSPTTVPGFDAQGDRGNEEDLEEGGLGIAIIKAVSDEFEAGERSHGHGSRLRFVKFLDN